MEPTTCKNCDFKFSGNYCPQCGQSVHEVRINARYFLHDIPHSIFHVDKGFFYTLKELFTRPGNMIKDYLEGKRVKYFRPFAYVALMSTVCTLLVKGLEWLMQKIYLTYNPGAVIPEKNNFFQHYFSFFIFLMIPFASLVTWLMFFKKKYNYWEHFLANTYIAAQLNIMLVLVNLAGVAIVFFTHKFGDVNFSLFIMVFMTGFLFLYGNVFGLLFRDSMRGNYKTLKISLRLTLMNLILFILYAFGLNVTGIMTPW